MKERPILMNGAMVRATLDGSKTQTRRLIKPEPSAGVRVSPFADSGIEDGHGRELIFPFGQPGDRLYVRETWMPDAPRDGTWPDTAFYGCKESTLDMIPERYRQPEHVIHRASWEGSNLVGWTPSIHMPRWASRIDLEITGVRVERLQDISEADAIAEGIHPSPSLHGDDDLMVGVVMDQLNVSAPIARFVLLWDSINGKFPNNWNANPWVWCVSFERVPHD